MKFIHPNPSLVFLHLVLLCFLHINPTWYRCSGVSFSFFFTLKGEHFVREMLYFFNDWHAIRLQVALNTEAKSSSILQGFPLHCYIAKQTSRDLKNWETCCLKIDELIWKGLTLNALVSVCPQFPGILFNILK